MLAFLPLVPAPEAAKDGVMVLVLLVLLLVIVSTVALARTITRDGYGSRPIPPSHYSDLPARRLW